MILYALRWCTACILVPFMHDSDGTFPALALISTATWSDALDQVGVHGVMHGIEWRSGRGRAVGRAITVAEEVGPLGRYPLDDFAIGDALQLGTAADVLVINVADGAQVSTFGGLAAITAAKSGMGGVIIDGGFRDVEDVRKSGLFLASRSVTPVSGKTRIRVRSVNESIACGGIQVSPSDLVISDLTGTVVVPAKLVEQVTEIAVSLSRMDAAFEDALATGQSFSKVARSMAHL
jgi:regulator of RNase E activity RraA